MAVFLFFCQKIDFSGFVKIMAKCGKKNIERMKKYA